MSASCCSNSKKALDTALFVLRIVLGALFIMHGYGKLFGNTPGMDAFTGMVAALKFPIPVFFAYAAALSEFFGGIAILLGVFTKFFATLIAIVMLVAIIGVKKSHFPSADVETALLAIAIALQLVGPGAYSIAAKWKRGGCCSEELSAKS